MSVTDEFFTGLDDAEETAAPTEVAAEPAKADPKPEVAAEPAKKEPEKATAPVEPAKPAAVPEKATATAPDPRHFVPVGTFLETKNELKEALKRLAALENPPKPKPAEPNFSEDPRGYVDTKVASVLEQLENATKPVRETAERADAAAGEARFMQALTVAEQTFVSQTPDYYDALQHIRNLREAELTTLHPDVPVAQIRQFMSQEELQLAANLMRSGRNPSEVAYTLAKARGYTPRSAKAAVDPAEVAKLVPDVAKPNQLPPDQTLGTGAGSPNAGDDTPSADDDMFDAAFKEVFRPARRA